MNVVFNETDQHENRRLLRRFVLNGALLQYLVDFGRVVRGDGYLRLDDVLDEVSTWGQQTHLHGHAQQVGADLPIVHVFCQFLQQLFVDVGCWVGLADVVDLFQFVYLSFRQVVGLDTNNKE